MPLLQLKAGNSTLRSFNFEDFAVEKHPVHNSTSKITFFKPSGENVEVCVNTQGFICSIKAKQAVVLGEVVRFTTVDFTQITINNKVFNLADSANDLVKVLPINRAQQSEIIKAVNKANKKATFSYDKDNDELVVNGEVIEINKSGELVCMSLIQHITNVVGDVSKLNAQALWDLTELVTKVANISCPTTIQNMTSDLLKKWGY